MRFAAVIALALAGLASGCTWSYRDENQVLRATEAYAPGQTARVLDVARQRVDDVPLGRLLDEALVAEGLERGSATVVQRRAADPAPVERRAGSGTKFEAEIELGDIVPLGPSLELTMRRVQAGGFG